MPRLIVETRARWSALFRFLRKSTTHASIGGKPWAEAETQWPVCRTCASPMQFLAQFPLSECGVEGVAERGQTLLLFQCQSQPGMCEEWEANGGGNAALLGGTSALQQMTVPPGATLLDAESVVDFRKYDDARQAETDDDAYCHALDADPKVLGKLGGRPLWIQADETPLCDCGAPAAFVAHVESRGGGGINFGDNGSGYAFVCVRCPRSAKFLWQCL